MGNEASQSHHKGSHPGSRGTVHSGHGRNPPAFCAAGTRRGMGLGWGQEACPHVHSIEILCFHLWASADSRPASPSSQVPFVVIFNFDQKVNDIFTTALDE